jgi:predicted DNA binding protein
MMIEVQIKTTLPPYCLMSALRKVLESAVIKIENISRLNGKAITSIVDLKAKEVRKAMEELPPVCEAYVVSSSEAKVFVREHTCVTALKILESGCLITSADIVENGVIWNLICSEDSFVNLVRTLENEGIDFDLLYKGKPGTRSAVTYREEEILRIALEKGYFDYPKKIKLEELSEIFGIAPSTLSEILRRGQKKILERYFRG